MKLGARIMARYKREIYSIGKLIRWFEEGELVLQPKFQRRLVWKPEARSYLIDTVLRELPMPKIFLRRVLPKGTQNALYEVVDGQQRLDAIICFRQDKLKTNRKFSADIGEGFFDDLPDDMQRRFLGYELSIEVMEDAPDKEVWAMFERLNTYTITLNRQERLNARYFGYFKQASYRLAAEQTELETWRNMKAFSDQQIARMREVELTSDILTAIVKGIQDITHITKAYSEFDDDFRDEERISSAFRSTMEFLVTELSEVIRSTRFGNIAWLYSLSVAAVDSLHGIPAGKGPKSPQSALDIETRMRYLNDALQSEQLVGRLAHLKGAVSRATSHAHERKIRHDCFFDMLTSTPQTWDAEWSD